MSDAVVRDVVFDLGGVLVDWDPRRLFKSHLKGASANVEAFLTAVCSPEWHATLDAGRTFEAATEALMVRFPEHAEWIDAYQRHWDKMFAGPILPAVQLLTEFRVSGWRIHALSNYPAQKLAFLYLAYPFMSLFDTVVVSGLVGLMKPDPEIYWYLLKRIDASTCLFIDDRLENVVAARACGISAVHFDGLDCVATLRAVARRGQRLSRLRSSNRNCDVACRR